MDNKIIKICKAIISIIFGLIISIFGLLITYFSITEKNNSLETILLIGGLPIILGLFLIIWGIKTIAKHK